MPELPEVEHARRMLQRWIGGARILTVTVNDPRMLDDGANTSATVRLLEGRRVRGVQRRGKWLRFTLDRGRVFSHLGMTGKWTLSQTEDVLRFEKVRLEVVANRRRRSVCYLDPRRFGRFVVVADDRDLPEWSALGPDALKRIDVDWLQSRLATRKLAIKPVLLDQTVLAGVGNIHATEALFLARIDPRRPARSLSRGELSRLARSIRSSLMAAIATQSGSSLRYIRVYGSGGAPCPRCSRPLSKVVLGGRGTVFCSHCQH